MTFHPKGLLVVAGFALLLTVADMRLGIAALAAYTAIDALAFLAPRFGRGRAEQSGTKRVD
jgi:hypothetical protein